MLFEILKEINVGKATLLHDMVDKPFAVVPPTGSWQREGEPSRSIVGESYTISIFCLTKLMVDLLSEAAVAWKGKTVRLGTALFPVDEVHEGYPGGVYYQDLLTRLPLPDQFTLESRTPTSFRQSGTQILFPLPELVFGNLLRRWNSFSPLQLESSIDFSQIKVKNYKLHTEMVHFEKYMVVGFIGWCTYMLPRSCSDFDAFHIHVLARFADLAGVGYKVTMGLGVTNLRTGS